MPEIVYRLDHNVAVVTFSNPPVNGLSHALRMGIADALARAQSDGSARGIVLSRRGRPLLRRRRHPRVRHAREHCRADPSSAHRAGRDQRQARRRLHHRYLPRRRPRAGDGRAPSSRQRRRKARPARGEARPPAGRGRHPATAAPGRRRAGDRDDRGRRAGTSRRSCGNPARRSRSRRRPATRGRGARGHGGGAPPQSPRPPAGRASARGAVRGGSGKVA